MDFDGENQKGDLSTPIFEVDGQAGSASGRVLLRRDLKGFGQGQLKKRLGLLAAHAWEAVEKIGEGVSRLKVNDQAVHRDAGAGEDGRAPHDLRIGVVNLSLVHRGVLMGGF